MSSSKIDDQLDQSFHFLFKILEKENLDLELFGITMTLFHYYTYYKSFKSFDKYKLIIACLFLACKIKGIFLKLDRLKDFYRKFSTKSSEISDKDITGFELDLLIFLGFEVDIETAFYYLAKLLKSQTFKEVLKSKIEESYYEKKAENNNKANNLNSLNNNTSQLLENEFLMSKVEKIVKHSEPNETKSEDIEMDGKKEKGNGLNIQKRETKVIYSNTNDLVSKFPLKEDYFKTLTAEEMNDKIISLSYIFLLDVYRRPFCIVFKPKCIALCCFLIAFNLIIEEESKNFLNLKAFFSLLYEEDEFKEFLVCLKEIYDFFNK